MTDTLIPVRWAHAGDLIQDRKGQLFRITKVAKVNFQVVDEDGKRWNLRKQGAYEAPAGAIFSGPTADESAPRAQEISLPNPALTLGVVCEFTPGSRVHGKGKYVIVRVNGATYSLAKLGGDNGRYVRGASAAYLRVVTAA